MAKVLVTCDQRDVVVDAGLRDKGVGDFGVQAMPRKDLAILSCSLPEPGGDRKQCELTDMAARLFAGYFIGKELRYNDRRQH